MQCTSVFALHCLKGAAILPWRLDEHPKDAGAPKPCVRDPVSVAALDPFSSTTLLCLPLPPPPPPPPPAYFDDLFVGCIAAQLDDASLSGGKRAYITVLGVLAPYRDRGVGTALLAELLASISKKPEVHEVALHVHVANVDAARFYARAGFEQVGGVVEGYYAAHRGVDPPDAFLLVKKVGGGV